MPHIYIHTKELEFHSFDKHQRDTHLFSVMPTYANYKCFFWPPRTIRRRRSVTTSREWGSLLGPRKLKVQGWLLGDFLAVGRCGEIWKPGCCVTLWRGHPNSLYIRMCIYIYIQYLYLLLLSLFVYLTDCRWLQIIMYIYINMITIVLIIGLGCWGKVQLEPSFFDWTKITWVVDVHLNCVYIMSLFWAKQLV